MRRIGTIPNEQDADRFRDYLLTIDIKAQIDRGNNAAVVWVLDEDRVEQAKSELAGFLAAPSAAKYATAAAEARRRQDEEVSAAIAARKRHIDLRQRWNRPFFMRVPVTALLIGVSVLVAILSDFGGSIRLGSIPASLFIAWPNRIPPSLIEIRSGELWRLVTPIFLHFGMLHLFFDMYILLMLGGSVEAAKGPWKLLGIVLFTAITSNFAQYLMSGPNFGGMSGVGFGLFGYLWMKSRYAPEEGFYLPPYVVAQFLFWMMLCLFGVIGQIANTAHVVGMLAGMAVAIIPLLLGLRRR
jgi:GlpG protein